MKSFNRVLILVLVFTLIISGVSLFYGLLGLHKNESIVIYTGYDTVDSGFVNLSISTYVNIEFRPDDASLNFGVCKPGTISGAIRLDNDAIDAVVNGPNCTGDNGTGMWITLYNIGNTYANVSVRGECSADEQIGGTGPLLNLTTQSCFGGDIGWLTLSNSTLKTLCSNMTAYNENSMFNISTSAIIPPDAIGGTGPCNDSVNTLTFYAERSS